MKILLIHKISNNRLDSKNILIPSNLYYIATILRDNGHDVRVSNYSLEDNLEYDLKFFQPEFVGSSCSGLNLLTTFDLFERIKVMNINIKTVLVGEYATFLANEILRRYKYIDYVIGGESEYNFLSLINKRPPKKVEINDLPIPAKYYTYQDIITSRGCNHKCIYCSIPNFFGKTTRFRDAQNVFKELELLHKKGISHFSFSDNTFSLDKNRVLQICKLIIDSNLKITWDCIGIIDAIDKECISIMKKSGCINISYDIVSGSQKILDNLGKNINIDRIKDIALENRTVGMNFTFNIIVGSPGENDESIKETIELLETTKPNSILINKLIIVPGSEISKKCNIDNNLWFDSENDIYYTAEKTVKELDDYIKHIYSKYNLTPYTFDELVRIIKSDPSSFQAFSNLGLFYMKKNMPKDALVALLKSIKINPGFFQSHNNLGVLCIKIGNIDLAERHFFKSIEVNPRYESALLNLARLYRDTKRDYSKYIKMCLDVNPNNESAKTFK